MRVITGRLTLSYYGREIFSAGPLGGVYDVQSAIVYKFLSTRPSYYER
jgi:hypothetical protein